MQVGYKQDNIQNDILPLKPQKSEDLVMVYIPNYVWGII